MKSKEKIIETIKNSKNYLQTLINLKWDTKTYGYKKLKTFIIKNNVDISHYSRKRNGNSLFKRYTLNEILIENSTYTNNTRLKERLYNEGLKERNCELCNQTEEWRGKKLSLILDHINGDHQDNRIENLRIVCPNCNATLDTHCGKNVKDRKPKKKKLGYVKETYIKTHLHNRKVERPPYDILLNDITNIGYSATGRKYGVSDNAIRNWIKIYNKYNI